jgi:hypothetical protein
VEVIEVLVIALIGLVLLMALRRDLRKWLEKLGTK